MADFYPPFHSAHERSQEKHEIFGHAHVEAWIPFVGGLWTLVYFVSLLSYVFADRAKGLDCGTPDG